MIPVEHCNRAPQRVTGPPARTLLAAVDLGSNSFHLLVSRARGNGFETVEHLVDAVRLAAGVGADGILDDAHYQHALATLRDFAAHIGAIPAPRIRAVATHAARELRDPAAFLRRASAALGHPIELISSNEEARLIWRGVACALAPQPDQRLVIDIGGGSTEFIIGRGLEAHATRSAAIGCVTTAVQFFPDGKLTQARWERSQAHLTKALQPFAGDFRVRGWQYAYGTSGSALAIAAALTTLGLGGDGITAQALNTLRRHLLRLEHTDRLAELQLAADHHLVFAGGVAVMQAAFDALGIARMQVCNSAMREGMLWTLHERVAGNIAAT